MFKANLKTFVAICRANNITPVLMTQFNRITEEQFMNSPAFKPYREKLERTTVTIGEYCGYYQHFNDIIRETATSENVYLIDLDKALPKNNRYRYDMVHVNNQGSKFAAEVIFRELENHLFSEPSLEK